MSKDTSNNLKLSLSSLTPNKFGTYDYSIEVSGFTQLNCLIRSVICVTQSAAILQEDNKDDICHTGVDIYNVLELITKLLPYDECIFLDELKKDSLNNS